MSEEKPSPKYEEGVPMCSSDCPFNGGKCFGVGPCQQLEWEPPCGLAVKEMVKELDRLHKVEEEYKKLKELGEV